jgi:tRNA (guanine37-N1)-methyltransferase
MAGVGPFAVPIARRGVRVYANDLNPDSHAFLLQCVLTPCPVRAGSNLAARRNATRNSAVLSAFNMDGGAFLHHIVHALNVRPTRCIMNLPASAVDMLGCFRGLYSGLERGQVVRPRVHCYVFAHVGEDDTDVAPAHADITRRAQAAMGHELTDFEVCL